MRPIWRQSPLVMPSLELPDEDQAFLNTAKLLAVFDWFEQQKELLDVAQTNDLEGAEGSDLAWSLTDGTLVILRLWRHEGLWL